MVTVPDQRLRRGHPPADPKIRNCPYHGRILDGIWTGEPLLLIFFLPLLNLDRLWNVLDYASHAGRHAGSARGLGRDPRRLAYS
jgi:hypothetical protein